MARDAGKKMEGHRCSRRSGDDIAVTTATRRQAGTTATHDRDRGGKGGARWWWEAQPWLARLRLRAWGKRRGADGAGGRRNPEEGARASKGRRSGVAVGHACSCTLATAKGGAATARA